MFRSLGPGWYATCALFLAFTAGGYLAYTSTRSQVSQVAFRQCMEQIKDRNGDWRFKSQLAYCQDMYITAQRQDFGLYGPRANATISLATMRRPDFRRRLGY